MVQKVRRLTLGIGPQKGGGKREKPILCTWFGKSHITGCRSPHQRVSLLDFSIVNLLSMGEVSSAFLAG